MTEKLRAKESGQNHPSGVDENEKTTWVQIYARNLLHDEEKGNNTVK